jgi:hypothetical protein
MLSALRTRTLAMPRSQAEADENALEAMALYESVIDRIGEVFRAT